VPSSNYRLFEQAIRQRKPVFFVYNGYPRELRPIILGHSQQQEKALTYQLASKQIGSAAGANGAVSGLQRSVPLNSATDPGEPVPAISSPATTLRRDYRPGREPSEPISPEAHSILRGPGSHRAQHPGGSRTARPSRAPRDVI